MKKLLNSIVVATLVFLCSFFVTTPATAAVTPFGSLRFPQPTATISVTGSAATQTAWRKAISAWNKTGAFTFVRVSGPAQVRASSWSNNTKDKNVAGLTQLFTTDGLTIDSATTRMNTAVLNAYHYSASSRAIVAEHELGHVIGLQHNPSKNSVMYFQNRYTGIKSVDINSVKQHYATPLPVAPFGATPAPLNQPATIVCGAHRQTDQASDAWATHTYALPLVSPLFLDM